MNDDNLDIHCDDGHLCMYGIFVCRALVGRFAFCVLNMQNHGAKKVVLSRRKQYLLEK